MEVCYGVCCKSTELNSVYESLHHIVCGESCELGIVKVWGWNELFGKNWKCLGISAGRVLDEERLWIKSNVMKSIYEYTFSVEAKARVTYVYRQSEQK